MPTVTVTLTGPPSVLQVRVKLVSAVTVTACEPEFPFAMVIAGFAVVFWRTHEFGSTEDALQTICVALPLFTFAGVAVRERVGLRTVTGRLPEPPFEQTTV